MSELKEPSFFKIYEEAGIDTNYRFNFVEIAILSKAALADKHDYYGGMTVYLGINEKEELVQICDCSIHKINHTITNLVNANLMRRVAPCLYQFNPYVIGKGSWEDILSTREKWDYQIKYGNRRKDSKTTEN